MDNEPTVNTTKAGSAVPVKLSLGGDFGLGILAAGSSSVDVTCDSGADTDEIQATLTAGGSVLRYDADSDTYAYVWKDQGHLGGHLSPPHADTRRRNHANGRVPVPVIGHD